MTQGNLLAKTMYNKSSLVLVVGMAGLLLKKVGRQSLAILVFERQVEARAN